MIGSFLTRALILALGYAYPAYNCYKTVEMNRPDIEKLRFWSKYWILIAVLTVVERFSDFIISWLPMYGEAKLAFIVYLWCTKTNGTPYVYDTFLRPLVSKHEKDIDRNLVELKTRATDIAAEYCSKGVMSSQTLVFEAIRYASHLLVSRTSPVKDNATTGQTQEKSAMPSARSSSEVKSTGATEKEDGAETTAQDSAIEDTIRVTRAKLRKRMGGIGTGTDLSTDTPK
ncbi:HVA22-like protein [Rhynchospora pubera]|uniref:HVA22-like protein n=1 Tax=Rhynchospora pubera TaxID=906938 RepID=A0AAV8ASB9_9POAL|nr:HVA22-like protein [Rhynchospora pubera]KAJ4774850.1 HVA22-like protein [Rhynchospora pubera]